MKKKKILLIQNKQTQFDHPLLNLIHENDTLDILVIYTSNLLQSIDIETGACSNWNHLEESKYTFYKSGNIFYIYNKCLNFKPDLVIISGWFPVKIIFLVLLLKLIAKKLALRSDAIYTSSLSSLKKYFLSLYFTLFDVYMPVGALSSDFFTFINPRAHIKIVRFPYCVDVNWIITLTNNLKVNHLKPHFNDSDYVLIAAIKFNLREDPITLLNAFCELRKRDKNYKLYLIGDGILKKDIEKVICSWSFDDFNAIYMPGYLSYNELIYFFTYSKVFIHPAFDEPFGVSLQEALASGLYSIISDKVGSRFDFVKCGINGDIFNSGSVEDLVDKVELWRTKYLNKSLLSKERIIATSKIVNYEDTINSFIISKLF